MADELVAGAAAGADSARADAGSKTLSIQEKSELILKNAFGDLGVSAALESFLGPWIGQAGASLASVSGSLSVKDTTVYRTVAASDGRGGQREQTKGTKGARVLCAPRLGHPCHALSACQPSVSPAIARLPAT